jgi:hypothetical protein
LLFAKKMELNPSGPVPFSNQGTSGPLAELAFSLLIDSVSGVGGKMGALELCSACAFMRWASINRICASGESSS